MGCYGLVNITCILVLLLIVIYVGRRLILLHGKKEFILSVSSAIIVFAFDFLFSCVNGKQESAMVFLNYLSCIGYFAFIGLAAYLWLCYVEAKIPFFQNRPWIKWVEIIPAALLFVMAITSYWTKFFFVVDESGEYQRSKVYYLQNVVTYTYIISAGIICILEAMKRKNLFERKNFLSIASFMILPVVGGIIQLAINLLPALNVAITLSYLLVFVQLEDNRISLDPLTGLFNRYSLKRICLSMLKKPNRRIGYQLIMLDIDHFKRINDVYGHIEGDHALLEMADCLKESRYAKDIITARYGGDEFLLMVSKSIDICCLVEEINLKLSQQKARRNFQYELKFSYGLAQVYPDDVDFEDIVNRADQNLYSVKNKKEEAYEKK